MRRVQGIYARSFTSCLHPPAEDSAYCLVFVSTSAPLSYTVLFYYNFLHFSSVFLVRIVDN